MPRCCNCKKEIDGSDVLCVKCREKLNSACNGNTIGQGSFIAPTTTAIVNYAPWEIPKKGLKNAVLSFIFGLISFILFWLDIVFDFIFYELAVFLIAASFNFAVVSLVLGFQSKNNYKKYVKYGVNKDKRIRRFSNFGIVFSIISLALFSIFMVFGLFAFGYMVLLVLFGYMVPGGI